MLTSDEVKFLAILVQKGRLPKEAAEKVLVADRSTRSGEGGRGLDQLLVGLGLLSEAQLAFLKRTGGENVPLIPGYEYQSSAGFGGTSLVFRGVEKSSGRQVALKILHPELQGDAIQRRRFVQEAKMLMDLEHPNVVKGYRVGHVKADGGERLVFIMEWIEGRTLLELLRDGKVFEEDLALFIILQVAKALQYMHGKGILHRDVKPDNVLLTDRNQVKLIDLGFATALDEGQDGAEARDTIEEKDETTLGTAAYMSPEQAKGLGDLDVRSDIYSLGATLYQIMVGELPFSGDGTREQLAARILEALSSRELQSRRISPHMNYFIRKMMEQDRDLRYTDMAALIGDIEEQIRGKKSLSFDTGEEGEDLLDLGRSDDGAPDGKPPPRGPPKFPSRRRRR